MNADGSLGKCTVNSDAGVKALTFMAKLALKDKVVQDGFTSQVRTDAQPIFYAGKAGYVFIGAWVESAMKQAGAAFPVTYAMIPPFKGEKQSGLVITDSIAFFSKAKNLKAAGKFIDFFYKDEWKGKFDQLVGFPPVTLERGEGPVLADAAVQGSRGCFHDSEAVASRRPFRRHEHACLDGNRKGLPGPGNAEAGP